MCDRICGSFLSPKQVEVQTCTSDIVLQSCFGCFPHDAGQTVIVITHDMNLAAEYCDRVVIMGGGRIILDAPVREAFQEQEALTTSSLHPPQVTLLGHALGYPDAWLTVDEAFTVLSNTRIGAEHGT